MLRHFEPAGKSPRIAHVGHDCKPVSRFLFLLYIHATSVQILHDMHENLLPGSASCQAFPIESQHLHLNRLSFFPFLLVAGPPSAIPSNHTCGKMKSSIILLVLVSLVAGRALPETRTWQGNEVSKGGRSLSIFEVPRREGADEQSGEYSHAMHC